MSKFTPAPWRFVCQGDANEYALLGDANRWVIAFRQNGEMLIGEQLANAQLISKAPELLEMLERIVETIQYTPLGIEAIKLLDQARPLIAEAKGGQHDLPDQQ